MSYFYSATTRGFYHPDLHGAHRISVPDPAWVRPEIEVADPNWTRPQVAVADDAADPPLRFVPDESAVPPTIRVPDASAVAPMIEVDNPACLIPPDAVQITDADYDALMAAQTAGATIEPNKKKRPVAVPPAPPTSAELRASLAGAVQAHLDNQARALGYDDIRSAVTYADEPAVPRFQHEGLALRAWRSRVWAHCYELLAEVEANALPVPSAEALIAELPPLVIEAAP